MTDAEKRPAPRPPPADVVVLGASAGGVGALEDLAERLKRGLGAAVLVVLHVPATGVSVLADILDRVSPLPVARAVDGMDLERGVILVAPNDHHLLVDRRSVRLSRGPLINGHRPAIDPLFESAARSFPDRVLGVVLSGMLDDGVAGLGAIKLSGGTTAVQDPAEAPYPSMPQAAIAAKVVDHILPVAALARLIEVAAADRAGPLVPHDGEALVMDEPEAPAVLSALTCPNCGGALWEHQRNGVIGFECRVGHQYSPAALFQVQGDALDDALWAAHRALLERADLARRMARRMRRNDLADVALKYDRTAEDAERRAGILNEALMLTRQLDQAHDGAR
jgi:two-component system chemotaxis response regulator CheB